MPEAFKAGALLVPLVLLGESRAERSSVPFEGVEEEEGEEGVGILAEAPGGTVMVPVSGVAIITRIPPILCHLQVWIVFLISTL